MIFIFESTWFGGFDWRPRLYSFSFNGRRSRRLTWGLWSLSYYRASDLKVFFEHIEGGNCEWRNS